jgi:hypothetical protein
MIRNKFNNAIHFSSEWIKPRQILVIPESFSAVFQPSAELFHAASRPCAAQVPHECSKLPNERRGAELVQTAERMEARSTSARARAVVSCEGHVPRAGPAPIVLPLPPGYPTSVGGKQRASHASFHQP